LLFLIGKGNGLYSEKERKGLNMSEHSLLVGCVPSNEWSVVVRREEKDRLVSTACLKESEKTFPLQGKMYRSGKARERSSSIGRAGVESSGEGMRQTYCGLTGGDSGGHP